MAEWLALQTVERGDTSLISAGVKAFFGIYFELYLIELFLPGIITVKYNCVMSDQKEGGGCFFVLRITRLLGGTI